MVLLEFVILYMNSAISMPHFSRLAKPLSGLLILMMPILVLADTIHIAVAANFTEPLRLISEQFEKSTGHRVLITSGSTGKIYTQIKNGAPYDLFFAADTETPAKLEQENAIVPGSRFTYAVGKLALWSAQAGYIDNTAAILQKQSFRHLAIANPKLAPYGRAAIQILQTMKLDTTLHSKIVQGDNIGQTYQFVASGNAELGFVALSQIYRHGQLQSGSAWIVEPSRYTPIRQDAVMLRNSKKQAAASALLKYLRSDTAHQILRSYGYTY